MQFQPRTISVPWTDNTIHVSEVMEAPGTGLAYQQAEGNEPRGYVLVHVPTGAVLQGVVETEEEAQRWLERVIPLVDWTLDEPAIRQVVTRDTLARVEAVAEEIMEASETTLKRLLHPALVKHYHEHLQSPGLSIRSLIDDAIDLYFHTMIQDMQRTPKETTCDFFEAAERELQRACEKHPPLHSLHEAYAVILEEVDELKAEVWKQTHARDLQALHAELVQIAAMCARTAQDCLA